jgi:hypothetical protein
VVAEQSEPSLCQKNVNSHPLSFNPLHLEKGSLRRTLYMPINHDRCTLYTSVPPCVFSFYCRDPPFLFVCLGQQRNLLVDGLQVLRHQVRVAPSHL